MTRMTVQQARDFGPQPDPQAYGPSVETGQQAVYGHHIPYDKGGAVRTPDIEPGKGRHADTWNVRLTNPAGWQIPMWVYEVEASFQLNGESVQSNQKRQFFPRNMVQPTMTVRGQVPNNYQYNRLALFVRDSHYFALNSNYIARMEALAGKKLSVAHDATGAANPLVTMEIRKGTATSGRNVKGPNNPMVLQGLIKNMTAGASRYEYAKEFEFDFVIATSQKAGQVGVYSDVLSNGSQILSWMDIFKKYHFASPNDKTGPTNLTPNNNVATVLLDIITAIGDLIS
jgi:hypothetical protein